MSAAPGFLSPAEAIDQIGGVRNYRELLLHPKSYAKLLFGDVSRLRA